MCKLSNSSVSRCCDPNNRLYDTVNEKLSEADYKLRLKNFIKMVNI